MLPKNLGDSLVKLRRGDTRNGEFPTRLVSLRDNTPRVAHQADLAGAFQLDHGASLKGSWQGDDPRSFNDRLSRGKARGR